MRGSPIVRTLIMTICLVVTALALHALSTPRTTGPVDEPAPQPEASAEAEKIDTAFFLTLSHPAKSVAIESSGEIVEIVPNAQNLTGRIPLEAGHPTIFLTVEWLEESSAPRFAKLVLEPSGLPTLTRYFEADGRLDDVWEPHLHH